jgi:hypothetical protein
MALFSDTLPPGSSETIHVLETRKVMTILGVCGLLLVAVILLENVLYGLEGFSER